MRCQKVRVRLPVVPRPVAEREALPLLVGRVMGMNCGGAVEPPGGARTATGEGEGRTGYCLGRVVPLEGGMRSLARRNVGVTLRIVCALRRLFGAVQLLGSHQNRE